MTPPAAPSVIVYVGHANPTGDILVFAVDVPDTGQSAAFTLVQSVSCGSSSSFLTLDPTRRFLYATQNRSDGLAAFARNPRSGQLEPLGVVPVPPDPAAAEAGPSYLKVDATARFVLCANYRGHNVVVFPRLGNGRLGPPVQNLSAGKHAHAIVLSEDNRFAFVPYLGSDLVAQYRFDDRKGLLTPNDPPTVAAPPGSGPRHLTFHPQGARAYLVNELDATVMAFDYDARAGTLVERQRIDSLPGWNGRRWAADLHVHPNGRFLYVSNRAHDSLAIFAIDSVTGRLSLLGHQPSGGRTPRNFCIHPGGQLLLVAHQDSANVAVFSVDPATGALRPSGDLPVAPSPTFVDIVPPV
jgi:6-phosphogluconolactonase